MDIYVCSAGDTLPRLDRRFSLAPGSLALLNGLSDPRRLAPGLALLLPEKKPEALRAMELWALPSPAAGIDALESLAESCGFICSPAAAPDDEGRPLPLADGSLLRAAGEYGALPFLTLANLSPGGGYCGLSAHRLISDAALSESFIRETAALCKSRAYRGLCLDIRFLPPFDRRRLSPFYESLSSALHAEGLLLALCLAAPAEALEESSLSCAGQDASAAAEYADRLIVRVDTPLASLPRQGRIVSALERWQDSGLPMEKTLLSLSPRGYGRSLSRPSQPARVLPMSFCADTACALGRSLSYDSSDCSAYFEYSSPGGGRELLRFPDLRGLDSMLSLIREFGMAGLALREAEYISPAGLALCRRRLGPAKQH